MIEKIEQDHRRFRDIVKGAIRKDLKKYLTRSEMLGKKGAERYVTGRETAKNAPKEEVVSTSRRGNRQPLGTYSAGGRRDEDDDKKKGDA